MMAVGIMAFSAKRNCYQAARRLRRYNDAELEEITLLLACLG